MIVSALLIGLATGATPADTAELPEALAVTEADVFRALDLDRPGLEAVGKAVAANDLKAATEAWAQYMRGREKPTLHFSRDTWAEFIRSEMPQLASPILEDADRVVRHELGHGPYQMPVEDGVIQWFSNPTKDTNYVSLVGSQWLLNPLGRAYLLTGDEKYAKGFVWFFDSWFDHRAEIREKQGGLGFDPMYRAYYPGIRARILLDNYYCLLASPALTADVQMKLMRELLGAARWLHNRNSRFQAGNQQVGAVLGPALVGLFFPEFEEAQAWTNRAVARMREHLERDFFADGGHKEICTQYHKTVLRDVGYVGLTQKANGLPSLFDDASDARQDCRAYIARAYDWLAAIVMPTGETPPLHSAVFANDWAIHLTIGARYLKRPDYWWLAKREWDKGIAPSQKSPLALSAYLICEQLSRERMADLKPGPPPFNSIHLDKSGFAVMRTGWQRDDRYLVFQYGWGIGGHPYPGALSFLLEMNGEVVATQPGSPRSYALPSYRYCHSTRSHNVVSIDNASYPSRLGAVQGGKVEKLADIEGAWYVRATHEGYQPTFAAVIERQMLAIKSGPIFWLDRVTGGAGHTARWHFHTPLEVGVDDNHAAHLTGNAQYTVLPADPEKINSVEVEQHWEAVLPRDCQPEDCGKVIPALAWVQAIGDDGAQFSMALVEGNEAGFEAIADEAFGLVPGEDRYLVAFAPGRFGDIDTDARCSCVRFEGDEPVEAWVFGGRSLVIAGTTWLAADEPTDTHVGQPD